MGLRFNRARFSLGAIQALAPAIRGYSVQSGVGSGPRDSGRKRRIPGTKHVEAMTVVRKPIAGRMTRTGEDAACKNAQTQISARQPVNSSVQRITPASDGTRQKNAGRRVNQKFSHKAQIAGPNAANFKRQPRTQILKYMIRLRISS